MALSISLTGPAAGPVNVASTAFTVSVVGTLGSPVVVTPTSALGGTISPATVTLQAGVTNPSATFTVTNTAEGQDSINLGNNGGLTNPAPFSYLVAPPLAAMIQIAGDAVSPPSGVALGVVPNTYAPILVTITSCPAQLVSATLAVKVVATTSLALLSKVALILDPGTVASNGSYIAKVLFNLQPADTYLLPPSNLPYSFSVAAVAAVGGGNQPIPAIEAGNYTSKSGGPGG